MSDLLTHLREVACNGHPICDEAADEILNMEAKLQAAERENSVIRGEAAMGLEQLRNKLQAAEIAVWSLNELADSRRSRIAELEAAIKGWYIWAGNDDPSDKPLDRLNDTAKALLGEGDDA